jgi:hypothetical protein
MPTLAAVIEGHSRRISQITQRRDSRLQQAADTRDQHLRALPAAAKLYSTFDEQLDEARDKQIATDARAVGARAASLQAVSETLRDALDKAHQVRRDADGKAFEIRRKAEDDAEREFAVAIAAAQGRTAIDAQKVRADKLLKSKKEFDEALAAAQEQFRQSRDAALIAEGQGARDAHRSFVVASSVSGTAAKSTRAAAEQRLAKALAAVPEAAAEVETWRKTTAAIVADYKREEAEEFERFHREMEALR